MKLFLPDIIFHRITNIDIDFLKSHNISALLLDVDNTLSTHHGKKPVDGLSDWLEKMRKDGIRLIVLSNSKEERVKPFAEKLGLEYISMACKPLPFKFSKALKRLNVDKKDTAIVGDQIFTDVMGSRLSGVTMLMVELIKPEEKLGFKIKRYFERIILKTYKGERINHVS